MKRDREAVELERDLHRLLDADRRISEEPDIDPDGVDVGSEPVLDVKAEVSDQELDAAWRDFKDRTSFEPGWEPAGNDSGGFQVWFFTPSWSPAMVLAALVVSAVLAMLGWQQAPVREAAVANPMIVDLLPDTEVRGSSDSANSIVVAMESDLMVLVIHPEVRQDFPDYGVEILDIQGEVIVDVVGIERTEYGNFQVAVWRSSLPEPPVHFRLSGYTSEGRETLGRYTLEFETAGLEAP